MGNSLLCHYIDNCFKEGKILWGQKHCVWGAKLRTGGAFAPPVPMLKKALLQTLDITLSSVITYHPELVVEYYWELLEYF